MVQTSRIARWINLRVVSMGPVTGSGWVGGLRGLLFLPMKSTTITTTIMSKRSLASHMRGLSEADSNMAFAQIELPSDLRVPINETEE